jgi:hypothetical protein
MVDREGTPAGKPIPLRQHAVPRGLLTRGRPDDLLGRVVDRIRPVADVEPDEMTPKIGCPPGMYSDTILFRIDSTGREDATADREQGAITL